MALVVVGEVGAFGADRRRYTGRAGRRASRESEHNARYPRVFREVDAIASMIAENSAFSIAAYKRLLAETDNVPLHLGLAHEVRNSAGVGPDMGERIAAFSKRKA